MKLSGDWEKLAKKLEKIATDIPQKVEVTLKQVAEETIKEVKEETPADTGQLRMGWHRKNDGSFKQMIYNNVEYVNHVEYGHRAVYFGKDTGKVVPGVFMLKKTIEKLEPVRAEFRRLSIQLDKYQKELEETENKLSKKWYYEIYGTTAKEILLKAYNSQ